MVAHAHDGARSAWMDVPAPSYAALEENVTADVCIVGAGIAGMSTAYTLAAEGRNVVVLDDEPAGGGMTQRTTAALVECDRRPLSAHRAPPWTRRSSHRGRKPHGRH